MIRIDRETGEREGGSAGGDAVGDRTEAETARGSRHGQPPSPAHSDVDRREVERRQHPCQEPRLHPQPPRHAAARLQRPPTTPRKRCCARNFHTGIWFFICLFTCSCVYVCEYLFLIN